MSHMSELDAAGITVKQMADHLRAGGGFEEGLRVIPGKGKAMRKATIRKMKAWRMLESAARNIGKGEKEAYPDFADRMKKESPEKATLADEMFTFGRYCLYRGDCRSHCCEEGRDERISDIMESAYRA